MASEEKLLSEAYKKAKEILKECISPIGIKASAYYDGYPQVWARDSMITLLGAMVAKDKEIEKAAQKSLETLALYQNELGCIPNCVDVRNKKANFGAYADGNSWFVIGHYFFYKQTGNLKFLKKYYPAIKKAILFNQYQDCDSSGLISMQEGADWQDLLATRGKGLYINVLYSAALKYAGEIAKICNDLKGAKFYARKSKEVKEKIKELLWVNEPKIIGFSKVDDVDVTRLSFKLNFKSKPYFLPYLSFREYGDWFDSLGNLLAIIFDIAEGNQINLILDYIVQAGIADPFPIKDIHPPIFPGDRDWREYYRKDNLNMPYQYHNGGIWPFVGGFYVTALVKVGRIDDAYKNLVKLAEANRKGKKAEWEFNEWLHGITGNPMGVVKQAWSAGMFIFAYEIFKNNKIRKVLW
jgi:glycogen debranching enzyme